MTAAFEHPVQILFHQAEISPEEPWVFFRPALDWQWYSFAQMAAAVSAACQEVNQLPAGTSIVFPDRCDPDSMVIDLAIQAAGHRAVPVEADFLAAPPQARATESPGTHWVDTVPPSTSDQDSGQAAKDMTFIGVEPLGTPRELLREQGKRSDLRFSGSLPAAEVRVKSQEGRSQIWTTLQVVQAAKRVVDALPTSPRRDVVVCHRPLREVGQRVLVTSALLQGWGLVLEPEPAAYNATVHWARPTLLYGTPEQLAPWHREPKAAKAWFRRGTANKWPRPLDRLRGVLIVAAKESGSEAAFWQQRGMASVPLGKAALSSPMV
ncbi:MAG: hypothetical protein K0U98_17890 [Deltaproteobacteria bacterium]|nr:hypothetical protein [Deltaproteobacteria bacterium]